MADSRRNAAMKSVLAVTLASAMCPAMPALDELGGGSSFEALADGVSGTSESSETSGTWGTCTWTLDADGVLVVKPVDGKKYGEIYGGTAPWQGKKFLDKITSVQFNGTCKVVAKDSEDTSKSISCAQWFQSCSKLKSVDLTGLDTSHVTDMGMMFNGCTSLESLCFSNADGSTNWNTSSVTDMGWMFERCSSLTSIDLSKFITTSVTCMNRMFKGCSSLTSLDVSGFNTAQVVWMNSMFNGCSSLTSLDVSSFKTDQVQHMNSMFNGCTSLESLRFFKADGSTKWDTSKVTEMGGIFCNCSSLTSLDLSSWSTSSLESVKYVLNEGGLDLFGMFEDCKALREVKLGDKFSFKGKTDSPLCSLPTPSVAGQDGCWVSSVDGEAYKPSEIEGGAATYTAQVEISKDMFTVVASDKTYTGESVTASVTPISTDLRQGSNYEVFYSNNVNAGTAKMFIIGTEMCTGTLRYEFEIAKAKPAVPSGLTATYGETLANVALPKYWSWDAASTSVGNVGEHKNEFKATYAPEGADATNYERAKNEPITVTVTAKAIDASMFSVNTSDATYTGKAVTGRVSSTSLTEDTDYAVTYSDNVNAGTAKVTISGKGNYSGTLQYSFKIVKAKPSYTVPSGISATYGQTLGSVGLPKGFSWQDAASTSVGAVGSHTFLATYTPADTANYEVVRDVPVKVAVAAKAINASMFSVDTSDATYTGKAITGRVSSKGLKEGTDYEVVYSGNVNVGTAKVTVKGKGNYSGTLSYSFKIVAPNPDPTPSPDPTPTPTPTPDPTPTPTPTPEPTPDPDPTPTPDPDPSPDPTPAPTFPDVDYSEDSWYAPGVTFCAEKGLMTGYSSGDDAGKFGVGRTLTRAELAAILWRNAEPESAEAYDGDAANATGMTDVADNDWYTAAANWAVSAEVIHGFDEGDHREFRPNDPVTAEQLATILANYADPDGAKSADLGLLSAFADSDAISDWARGSVAWAKAKDIVNGYDEGGTRYLKPYEDIARERVATILMNAFESGVLK